MKRYNGSKRKSERFFFTSDPSPMISFHTITTLATTLTSNESGGVDKYLRVAQDRLNNTIAHGQSNALSKYLYRKGDHKASAVVVTNFI